MRIAFTTLALPDATLAASRIAPRGDAKVEIRFVDGGLIEQSKLSVIRTRETSKIPVGA
jgi:hypothetical protein